MTSRLLISVRPGETRGALVEDDRLSWFDFVRTLHEDVPPRPLGAVCLGRVRKVEPGMQAAFVDLGAGEDALLSAKDARILDRADAAKPPIERLVHEGEAVLIQISRLSRDGKGPRVTADLALPGADKKTVRPRRGEQTSLWAQLQERARSTSAPALLWRPPEPDPAVRLWQEAPTAPDVIEIDHNASAAALRRALADSGETIEIMTPPTDVFAAYGLEEEVDGLSAPHIPLKSGGGLLIEPTAALIAIDVNARGALASTTEDTALKVNLEAAREIPRQIALRRLGGIVVVDFLRLKAARHRREIVATLKGGLERHRIAATVSGFSAAGLVELVVPRAGAPLHERLLSACPHCGGRGAVPDVAARALSLLARIVREARHGGGPGLTVHAPPEMIAWLDAHSADVERELERFAVTNVSWRAESDWPPEFFEIRPAGTS